MAREQRYWDKAEEAQRYDKTHESIIGSYVNQSELAAVQKLLDFKRVRIFFDAGCGTGRYLTDLPEHIVPVGMDCSWEMLKIAKSKVKNALFILGELENLPFKTDSFDKIICVRVLQHIKRQQQAINELGRTCTKGGEVVLLSLNSWTLHCLYKNLRMSRLQKIINLPFKFLLRDKSPFVPWALAYDNYCSGLELKSMLRQAGLNPGETSGTTIGFHWFFMYFHLDGILERLSPRLFKGYFNLCHKLEKPLGRIFPFKYFMDKILIRTTKD